MLGDDAEGERAAGHAEIERAVEQRLRAAELRLGGQVDEERVQRRIADPLRGAEQRAGGEQQRHAVHERDQKIDAPSASSVGMMTRRRPSVSESPAPTKRVRIAVVV